MVHREEKGLLSPKFIPVRSIQCEAGDIQVRPIPIEKPRDVMGKTESLDIVFPFMAPQFAAEESDQQTVEKESEISLREGFDPAPVDPGILTHLFMEAEAFDLHDAFAMGNLQWMQHDGHGQLSHNPGIDSTP
jgi:hypothetical protein